MHWLQTFTHHDILRIVDYDSIIVIIYHAPLEEQRM